MRLLFASLHCLEMERKISSFFGKRTDSATSQDCMNPKQIKVDGSGKKNTATASGSETSSQKKSQPTASVKTVKKWEAELNIELLYETSENDKNTVVKMYCALCKTFSKDKSSNFVTGSSYIKKESVVAHKKSDIHQKALDAKAAAKKIAQQQPTDIESSFLKMESSEMVKMKYLFNTAYFIAKQEKPFTDFEPLIKLQKKNSISLGETYCNDMACKKFISEIAGGYFDELKACLEQADYFSIFSDGTTDRTESEKECIMIKYIENFYPVIKYFKLEEPANTKAEGILECVEKAFSDFGLVDFHEKLVGYCSDGASVMMGSKKGVIKLLKDNKNAPWVLSVWCLAHRLELAVKDCFKSTYMDEVIDVLRLIYDFYKGSSKRNKEAREISDIMDEEFLKPEKVNGTRWVEHKLRATSKLLRNWMVILIHMQNYAEDVSNKDSDRAKAKGIIVKLLQYKFVWFLHFLKDILNEVATVSLTFQREDINVSSAVSKLQATELNLRDLYNNNGSSLTSFFQDIQQENKRYIYKEHALRNFIADDTLETQKKAIVQSMIDCLHSRFENLTENQIFLVCHAFDHKNWPDHDNAALLQYGADEVRHVYNHFESVLERANCDLNDALREFTELKLHVTRNPQKYRNVHPLAVWQRISQEDENRADFVNILKIIHLTSVYPLSNACCERTFSALKRVKSDWRCSLSTATIDQLLRIVLTGPELDDFDANPVVNRWWISGQRTKRPTVLPYGPRN